MPLKRLYRSVSCVHAALYTAFGSPGLGITWSVMTFLSALFYLIYDKHNRQTIEAAPKKAAELKTNRENPEIKAQPDVTI